MTENLVLEHLRHIRETVDSIAADMKDMKVRMTNTEESLVVVSRRLDRIDQKVDRLETRTGLVEN